MTTSWSTDEIMTIATSKYIHEHDTVFIGTGLPMVAAYFAKATHAPSATLLFESGVLDPEPKSIAKAVGDPRLVSTARRVSGMLDSLLLLHGGRVDLGVLGCAQIDRYGNVNTTAIGDYAKPSTRLPGSGGANDIASMAKRHVIVTRQTKRTFVERVDYVTSPGYLTGPGARERAGLPGRGPLGVITDMAVFGFDERTCEMTLESLHPGVALDDVRVATGFEFAVAPAVGMTPEPASADLEVLRGIDPEGVYLKAATGR